MNIREIDAQHQKLFASVNDLYEAMQEEHGRDIVGAALRNLVDRTVFHFTHEEKLFRQHGYAEEEAHRARHSELIERLKAMKQEFDAGQTNVTLAMFRFLTDWLNNHIMGEDKRYVGFLIAKGVS